MTPQGVRSRCNPPGRVRCDHSVLGASAFQPCARSHTSWATTSYPRQPCAGPRSRSSPLPATGAGGSRTKEDTPSAWRLKIAAPAPCRLLPALWPPWGCRARAPACSPSASGC